jgi:ABC-type phosphate transport system auxiliary subunit
MTEEELIFLISVTVIMPILALWIIVGYQKARLKHKRTQPDRSLTTTELDDMIEQSVHAATTELHDRIDQLEEKVRQLDPTNRTRRIELEEEAPDEEDRPAKTLGRTRS